jgi:hypothetical protein
MDLIKTVGSQLSDDLQVKKIWSPDLWHLTNRVCSKILAHMFTVIFRLREKLCPLSLRTRISI